MLLIKNGLIRTMRGAPIAGGQLLLHGGRIVDVGETVPAPADADVIDATGLTVTPGLIDAHCHTGLIGEGVGREGEDVNELADPVTPQLRAIDGINPRSGAFWEAARAGVTTVVTGPGSANVVGGQFLAMKTVGVIVDEMVIRDPVAMKIAFGENPKRCYGGDKKTPMTRMANAALLRELLMRAKIYCGEYDQAKNSGKKPGFDAKLHAMLPVMRGEIPLKAHAHQANDMFTAIRVAKEFGLRLVLVHCTEGHLVAEKLAREINYALVGPNFGSRSKYELREKTFETPGALYRAGMKVAIVTDAPEVPLPFLPFCAGLAIKGGLPEEEAWLAITRYPAEIMGIDDRAGSLSKGLDGDVVLFRGDPLRQIESEAIVTIVDGRLVSDKR